MLTYHSKMQFSKLVVAMGLLVVSTSAAALPEAASYSNLAVFVRDENFAYTISDEHTARVRRDMEAMPIQKRAHATVQQCYQQGCQDCHTIFDGDFTSNSCLDAVNTACLIVSNLDDAKISFWNHIGCNHNKSTYNGCNNPATNVNAPGTNSIGVQLGC